MCILRIWGAGEPQGFLNSTLCRFLVLYWKDDQRDDAVYLRPKAAFFRGAFNKEVKRCISIGLCFVSFPSF
jgi:hypothetical protein